MKSLRDQLLKAGVVDKKQVKQVEHAKRVERKTEGFDKQSEAKKQKEQEWQLLQEKERRLQQELARTQVADAAKRESIFRARDIIDNSKLKSGWTGNRKFYFVAPDGKISCLQVSDSIGRQLEKGELAIVEIPGDRPDHYALIERKAALNLEKVKPENLLFFNT